MSPISGDGCIWASNLICDLQIAPVSHGVYWQGEVPNIHVTSEENRNRTQLYLSLANRELFQFLDLELHFCLLFFLDDVVVTH